jgi:hypothetical protein
MGEMAMKSLQEIREDIDKTTIDSVEKQELDEGILKNLGAGLLIFRVRSLMKKIEKESDPVAQISLLGKQNAILSYLLGVAIFTASNNKEILAQLKRLNPKTL